MGRRCGVVRSACRPHWRHSQRDEIATDCRIDLMSDHWPLRVAEPLDGERLTVNFALARAQSQLVGTITVRRWPDPKNWSTDSMSGLNQSDPHRLAKCRITCDIYVSSRLNRRGISVLWRNSSEKRWIASPTVGVYTTGISSVSCSASTLKYKISWR